MTWTSSSALHNYTDKELEEVAEKIVKAKPDEAHVFFNNDTATLVNAKKMLDVFKSNSTKAAASCAAGRV